MLLTVMSFRRRGSLPWSRVLEMVEFMADEIEYPPHFAFQRVRDQLLNAFKGTADMPNIKVSEIAGVKTLIKTTFMLVSFRRRYQITYLINVSEEHFSDVAPDVRRTQYCYGLAQTPNGIDVVEKLYKWFVKNSYYFRRDDDNLLHALACLQDEATKKRLDDFHQIRLIADVLDGHYPVVLLEYIAQRDSTDTLLWDYLVANSDAVFYGVPSLSYYMDVAVGSWNTQQQLDKVTNNTMAMSTTIFKWIFIVVCIFDYHTLYADITFVDNKQQHVSEVGTPPSHFKDKQQLEVNARYGEADVAEHEDLKRLPNVLEPKEYYIRIKPYFPYPAIQYPQGTALFSLKTSSHASDKQNYSELFYEVIQKSRSIKQILRNDCTLSFKRVLSLQLVSEELAERNMTFDGVTTFIFKVKKATSVFVLHAHNLVFDHVEFTDNNGISIGVKSTTVNATLDHVTVEPAVVPTVGETYLLQFKYRGIINSYELGGLFYTYYDDIQQTRHWMVATHMETGVHARSLFPCLDEPAYKAIFHMTIIYPKPLIALSNMMERPYVELHDPWVVVRFPPTPKLSTYLVAMAVGPYVSKSITNKAGTLEEYLGFAAMVAGKCLDSLGEYVNFPFPLSKSDQLGLPKFPAGAVENMGLVIYKYQYIQFNEQARHSLLSTELFLEKFSLQSIQVKQKAAGVICHELAHQWFGDLVTMTWWPELVVNEGFANYFEIYNQAMAFPEHAQFLNRSNVLAFRSLIMKTKVKVFNFAEIVYDKGASIYRMAHITLGDKAWQEGLTDYIHSYKWGNANHEMLFAKLTKAAQAHNIVDWCGRAMDVAKFLDPWFLQQCFPLITVTNNQLMAPAQFTQQPFDKQTLLPTSNFSYSWPVPMHIRDYKGDHKSILHWLKPSYDQCGGASRAVNGTHALLSHQKQQQAAPSNKAYSSPNQFAVHWELGNSGMVAFARTQYDDIGYSRLVEDLRKGSTDYYSMADRVAFLGDEIALLRSSFPRISTLFISTSQRIISIPPYRRA
ncbi:unnamed protein product [Anisakis simplex]|uniref:Uncharacterized protein n=1 Tax=Anisakis simplex TaxID=6269 RepID=A0A3P6MYV4_ANISI|nr:unnamed protein product [Anisakis simplex]